MYIFSIFVKLLAMYAVYKSMRFVAPWRWPQPVAEQYRAVTDKHCETKWMWSLMYVHVAVTSEMSETTAANSTLCYKPKDHNLYNEKIYLIPRILKCNHQLCSWIVSTFCQTPLSSFGKNSLHTSVISSTILMQVLWVCASCFHVCLRVGSHLCNNVLKLQKSLQICVTSFHFPSHSTYSPCPLHSSTHY